MAEADLVGVVIGFVLGLVSLLVARMLDVWTLHRRERLHLERRVREELYPSLYAVMESLRRTALDPVKKLASPDVSEEETKVLVELLKAHQKWLEILIYERGLVTYLEPDPKLDVFKLYRDIIVAITRINLRLRPYIQYPGRMVERIEGLADHCEVKLGIQKRT